MRLHINDIAPERRIIISGDEPWLQAIYDDFPTESEKPKLTGELRLALEEGTGGVHVTGKLAYAPMVDCSRCCLAIAWPLDLNIDARFLPEAANASPKEKNLSRDELDAYDLQGHEMDLEELINDSVQTALPTSLVPVSEDGDSCQVCNADLRNDRLYGSDTEDQDKVLSPFAALKNVKLPE